MRAILAQPKRFALLAFLAAARPSGFHRRDALLALFWPEFDEASARAALSRAVYHLRQSLGEACIVSRGEQELGLSREQIGADLWELDEALSRRDAERALALFPGELLAGFHLDDAHEFDRWLSNARDDIRSRVLKVVTDAGDGAERDGDLETAALMARHAVRLAPYSEPAMLALIRRLGAQDNRAEALVAYQAFARKLYDDLETAPGQALTDVIAEMKHPRTPAPVHVGAGLVESLPQRAPSVEARPRDRRRASGRARRSAPWLVGAVVLIALAWLPARERFSAEPATVRFSVAIPENEQPEATAGGFGSTIALSADGSRLAYVGRAPGGMMLYLRALDEASTRPIAGTEGAMAPAFSPDGKWLAYWAKGTIRKVQIVGGVSESLLDAWFVDGITWLTPDLIVTGRRPGEPQISSLDARGVATRLPMATWGNKVVALHDGVHLLFIGDSGIIRLGALRDTIVRSLGVSGNPVGVVDRWMIYVRPGGALMALPVDVRRGVATGPSVRILGDELVRSAAISATGTLAYVRRSTLNRALLTDLDGRITSVIDVSRDLHYPAVAPDGKRIAFAASTPDGADVHVYDIASATFSRISFVQAERPAWSADGRRIGYTTSRAFWSAADGSGDPLSPELIAERLPDGDQGIREVTFSPDGRFAVLRVDAVRTRRDLWLMPLAKRGIPGAATELERSPFNELMARVSPDSRQLAFVSDASGEYEVYLRPFPGAGERLQVSAGGGTEPVWAPDGSGLYYRSQGHFFFATLSRDTPRRVVSRRMLFRDSYVASPVRQEYDVMPNGRQLLLLAPSARESATIFVVLGWRRELREQLLSARPADPAPRPAP